MITGPGALDPGSAPLLTGALRRLVVVRGDQAMPLRDPLPLKLPKEITDSSREHAATDPADLGSSDAAAGVEKTAGRMPAPGVRIVEIG
jgi:hypothetical protein